jgi:hypothetical protein
MSIAVASEIKHIGTFVFYLSNECTTSVFMSEYI